MICPTPRTGAGSYDYTIAGQNEYGIMTTEDDEAASPEKLHRLKDEGSTAMKT